MKNLVIVGGSDAVHLRPSAQKSWTRKLSPR